MKNWTSLPKVELHRHLDCSIRPATLRTLLKEELQEETLSDAEFRERYLVTKPMLDLESVLKKFLAAQKALTSESVLKQVTIECIEDAVRDGVRILELRYAPTFIQEGHPLLSFANIHNGILSGINACKNLPIAVGLIATIQRTKSLALASSVVDFVIDHKETFVGVDLADNENGFDAKPFSKIFNRAKDNGLHITIHAGEAKIPSSAQNVVSAINELGAERIGHGIQIFESESTVQFVKNNRIPLEICPTSNVLTNSASSISTHPIRKLFEAGVLVSINTDDPGVFDISLNHEYNALADSLAFTENEFKQINQSAAESSFLSLEQRQRVWPFPLAR